MPFLTQSRFPTLWKIFQFLIGGTIDKRKLCILKYQGQQQILEVGCSLGNIATVFQTFPDIQYTGIDIDPIVIQYAQKDFADYPNFRFLCQDLRDFSKKARDFDYVVFAGVLHHIEDDLCKSLLMSAQKLMPEKGCLVVVDPLLPEPEDNWFIHWFLNLEQGQYVRKSSEMHQLLSNLPGLKLEAAEIHYVGAIPFSLPKCARFGVYSFSKVKGNDRSF